MGSSHHFAIRRMVIEYGSIPIASWLHHLDSNTALAQALQTLREAGQDLDGGRRVVDIPTLARCLDVPVQHSKILVDTLDAVTESHHLLVRRPPGRSEADAVDVHAVALFLFAQLYIRQAQRPDAMEVWPSPNNVTNEAAALGMPSGSGGLLNEPQSPARSNSSGSSTAGASRGHNVQFQQQKSNQLVRRELQAHLQQHASLLHGYTDHMRRQTHALLPLVLNKPLSGVSEGSYHGQGTSITAGEFDRLSFLLRTSHEQQQADSEGGSPMDVSPTPFTEDGWRLSLHVPLFTDSSESCEAPLSAVAEWLANNIFDEVYPADAVASSPRKGDYWNSLPLAGVVQGGTGGIVDIQGVVKSTVVRGEDDFPSGTMRITDCHDTIIYALAPLQYASVICCSDCTVVVGAVARMLRVERCERLTLIAASVRICIATCHDSTFYLGVNRPPLLIGDNRGIQMAPYNTQYERLPVHLAAAGVEAKINLWDQPVTLALPHKHATPDSGSASSPGSTATSRPPVQMLNPDKLLPFMVPFQGGHGPLCGGAASGGVTRLAADLGSFVGLGEGPGSNQPSMAQGPLPSSPFQLPPAYQEAKERKVHAVTDLRQHIKLAVLDDNRKRELQAVIQAEFKSWLTASGTMRQVYDLARMEREEGGLPASPRGQ